MASQAPSLSYVGSNFLRQRLVLSTLSGRPVKIRKIRAKDDNPGLRGWLVRDCQANSLGTIWGVGVSLVGRGRRCECLLEARLLKGDWRVD